MFAFFWNADDDDDVAADVATADEDEDKQVFHVMHVSMKAM